MQRAGDTLPALKRCESSLMISLVKSSGSFCHVSVHPCHAMSTFHFLRSPPFLLRSSSLICSGSREPQKSFSLALLHSSQSNPCDGRNHELLGFSVGRRHRTKEQLEGSLRLREFNHIVVTGFQDSLGHPQNIVWGMTLIESSVCLTTVYSSWSGKKHKNTQEIKRTNPSQTKHPKKIRNL